MGTFLDRRDAGRRLAEQLLPFRDTDPVVIALPRGEAPLGDEIARALEAPLDMLVARKLGAPGNPELAIRAIAPGVVHLEPETIRALAVSEDYIRKAVAVEQEELRRRELRFREGRPALPVSGRTVILVDDGLATGATAVAAIESLRRQAHQGHRPGDAGRGPAGAPTAPEAGRRRGLPREPALFPRRRAGVRGLPGTGRPRARGQGHLDRLRIRDHVHRGAVPRLRRSDRRRPQASRCAVRDRPERRHAAHRVLPPRRP